MKLPVEKRFIICFLSNKRKGFLLAELQVSVAILAIVVALLYSNFCQILQGWQRMFLDMQLQDAGRYMLSVLEKDLCYEGRLITLSEDYKGAPKIICQTGNAGKTYTYTWEGRSFYKSTKTTSTSGKNPLFVPDCQVIDWQAQRINDSFLKLSFVLQKQNRCQSFTQLFYCFNGSVVYE